MHLHRELRTYVSALASLPIMIMLINESVAMSLVEFAPTLSFASAVILIALYVGLRKIGFFIKIKWALVSVLAESIILVAPIIYPMVTVLQTGATSDFVGVFLAYMLFGVLSSIYQTILGAKVGAFGKVSFFLFAYILSLMIYAGALFGQQTGEVFSILLAFDQIAGAAVFFGYLGQPVELPLARIVKLSMIVTIPAITFSALAAQVRLSEVRDNPGGETRMVSSLRPAVAMLTFGSSILLVLALAIARLVAISTVYLVTIIPPLIVAGLIVLILIFTERTN